MYPDRWDVIAARIGAWSSGRGIVLRDVVVLVPFAQLLPEARRAFARAGGWMPRVETTRTLAASLGPPPAPQPGDISLDPTLDALGAAALLRSQPWGLGWARRDRRGFDQAVDALVRTAHELVRAASAWPPAERPARWAAARESLAGGGGPGATERLLARVALEWACVAPVPATDRSFEWSAPGGWVAVQAGGADPLTLALLGRARVPTVSIDTDPPADRPFETFPTAGVRTLAVCDGFEHEAQCAAAQVLAHVRRGEVPVALIAQDRALVRRIRALLERHRVRLLDETGWKLSTTRAAAIPMALLRAARAEATTDDLFDWMKAGTDDTAALEALEAQCRRGSIARVNGVPKLSLPPSAERLWTAAAAVLAPLTSSRRQPLTAWLSALGTALDQSGALRALAADEAGEQVVAVLHLDPASDSPSWQASASQALMGPTEFRSWVDAALERATFRPSPGFEADPEVIVTPLAGAMLRPFAAAVLPGADDKHLGGSASRVSLLDDEQAALLGLETGSDRRHAELLAFVHLLETPRLTLTRRRADGGEPLGDSPLVERLARALAVRGRSLSDWDDPRIEIELEATPIHMTAPAAPGLLPQRLSASACEALRACPYRFFALRMLLLREDEELEREVEKRDYGNWLHGVLFDFHTARSSPADAATEISRLMALAGARQEAHGIGDADFLPFAASFERFAPRYVAWLHQRDVDGSRWLEGETEIDLHLDRLGGIALRGIIDRVDVRDGGARELIDYKTGSAAGLKEKVREPFEDTQLAFYAALMRSRTSLPLTARYLALDGSKGIEEIEHREVDASAAALVDGLAFDLDRLRAGHGLPALGVGSTCDHCAARGVCRKDHWAEGAA